MNDTINRGDSDAEREVFPYRIVGDTLYLDYYDTTRVFSYQGNDGKGSRLTELVDGVKTEPVFEGKYYHARTDHGLRNAVAHIIRHEENDQEQQEWVESLESDREAHEQELERIREETAKALEEQKHSAELAEANRKKLYEQHTNQMREERKAHAEQLALEAKKLEEAKALHQGEYSELQAERAKLDVQEAKLQQQINDARAKQTSEQASIEAMRAETQRLRAEQSEAQRIVSEHQAAINAERQRIANEETAVQRTKAESDALKARMEKERADLEREKQAATQVQAQLDKQVQAQQTADAQARKRIADIEAKEKRLANLETREAQIKAFEDRLKTERQQTEQNNKTNAALIEKLTKDLAQCTSARTSLDSRMSQAADQVASLQQRLSARETELSNLEKTHIQKIADFDRERATWQASQPEWNFEGDAPSTGELLTDTSLHYRGEMFGNSPDQNPADPLLDAGTQESGGSGNLLGRNRLAAQERRRRAGQDGGTVRVRRGAIRRHGNMDRTR